MAAGVATSIDGVTQLLARQSYLASRELSTILSLALRLQRPVLLEGEPGVGKTAVAGALAAGLGARVVRLQCYEGIDASSALYDWSYTRQLLALRAAGSGDGATSVDDVFTREFLVRRPLLDALENDDEVPPVLLIDEIDRADDAFEAFLLEFLAEFQVTIPELGTIRSERPPLVILTSNRTRELHDALRRRALYHWIAHPDPAREAAIIAARLPHAAALAASAAAVVTRLRAEPLVRVPGTAEALDWTAALALLGEPVSGASLEQTLGVLVKHPDDVEHVRSLDLDALVEGATRRD
jgi:MoxR-like ATPase